MSSAAVGRAQSIETAQVMASILRESGDGWWATLDGRQLSPTSLADDSPLLGTSRIVLATTALARGFHDRRWATAEEAAHLGYGPYRNERPTVVPVMWDKTTEANDITYVAMLNAEQLRSGRGGGMRAGSPVPPEQTKTGDQHATIDAIARAAMSLAGNRTLVARVPNVWNARHVSRLVEAAALATMCYCPQAYRDPGHDAFEALAMTANLAAAMAFSDLGIPPACARPGTVPTKTIVLRWAEAIQSDPNVLFAHATEAERIAAKLVEVTGEVLEAMAEEDEDSIPQPLAPQDALGDQRPDSGGCHAHDGRDQPAALCGARAYTLRSVAAESRVASKALAGAESMGR